MNRSADAAKAWSSRQGGVVARHQALGLGMTDAAIDANLHARRWQRIHPGVYATFTGPLPEGSRIWAALLWAGDGAALADLSALRQYGFESDDSDATIHVRVDHDRRVIVPDGIAVRRRRRLDAFVHPVREPRVLRIEDAALHAASDRARRTAGLALLADVCNQRLTTVTRLRDALTALPKLPSRKAFWAVLDDIATGASSFLEVSYLRQVERAHRLPVPRRQVPGLVRAGRVWRDGEYDEWGVILELDGRLGHDGEFSRGHDRRRDLIAAAAGKVTIRSAYTDVVDAPCDTAALVGAALRARGWAGLPISCGASCDMAARLESIDRDALGLAG